MPSRNKGKTWTWSEERYVCNCGSCRKCRGRINSRDHYRRLAGLLPTKSLHAISVISPVTSRPPFTPTKRDWDKGLDDAAAEDMLIDLRRWR